ncbi:hypothetical protein BKA70DRAFT_1419271 [Coprinopsis sp. MPI-PUGE-AT-0042]|nr:hypothetical protein BKA70DRAFT_1419271 [Coprinopsis sp. MPI-PUGE-AT-0042]
MSNNNYESIVFYLHAYLGLHSHWATNAEGKERARIVVMGLAMILANGPKDRLKKKFVGTLVYDFLCALSQRQEWTTAGATIDPEDFVQPGVDYAQDPILRQVEPLGFAELHRRSVEILEVWNHASSESKTGGMVAGGGNGALAGSSGGSGGVVDAAPSANEDAKRRYVPAQAFKPLFKYCRGCRRMQRKDVVCSPPGSEQACFECKKWKKKCTNRKMNLKFPDDPDRDMDNERDLTEEVGPAPGSHTASDKQWRQPSAAPPAIHLPDASRSEGPSHSPTTLAVPQQARGRGRSKSPKPAKQAKPRSPSVRVTQPRSPSARITRSRSRTPAPALPPPHVFNTASTSTSLQGATGDQVHQGNEHFTALNSRVERLETLSSEHQGHIAALRSETRGLVAGYKDARDDVGLLREMVKVHETSIARLEELRAKEVQQFQEELAERGREIVELRRDLRAALATVPSSLSSDVAAAGRLSQGVEVIPPAIRVAQESPNRSNADPAIAFTQVTKVGSSVAVQLVNVPSAFTSSVSLNGSTGEDVFSGKTYKVISTAPPAPESMSSAKPSPPHGLIATSAFLGTTDANLKGIVPRYPPHAANANSMNGESDVPRSATPSSSAGSELTDIEDADDSASASASNSGKNKRKAATKADSTVAKKSRVASALLKPTAAARGKGRGRNPGVAASRRSIRLNDVSPAVSPNK